MATEIYPEFKLKPNAYTALDATSLKRLMIERLSAPSNVVFTDQNFTGSNLNAIIDIVAYSYQTLLFYLNQTSSEAVFTDTQLYENINRIVKLLNYNPIGDQTASVPFVAASTLLAANVYTIPRYSYIALDGVAYTFNEDVTFEKTTQAGTAQTLKQFSSSYLLYQGKTVEYPSKTAVGAAFETLVLTPGNDVIVDNFNIDVYVLETDTGSYFKYQRVDSLFLHGPQDRVCEIRLNENKNYEIKFGDNITGKKLTSGDTIAIYFLQSEGNAGVISANRLSGLSISIYNTPKFNAIFNDVKNDNLNYLNVNDIQKLSINNEVDSTQYFEGEDPATIKQRAPQTFTSQYRLVNSDDYKNYVERNFSNFVYSANVLSNEEYLNSHLKYLVDDLKLNEPNLDTNVLSNQILFSSSTNFNNVYIYCVPKTSSSKTTTITKNNFISPSQKNNIISSINSIKTINTDPIIMDPVYIAFAVGNGSDEILGTNVVDLNQSSTITVITDPNIVINKESLKQEIISVIQSYFDNLKIGGIVDITELNTTIINLNGVLTVKTNGALGVSEGVNFIYYNYQYPEINVNNASNSVQMEAFMYPYLPQYFTLSNIIKIA